MVAGGGRRTQAGRLLAGAFTLIAAALAVSVLAGAAEYWFAPLHPADDCTSMPAYYGDTTLAMINGAPGAASVGIERADGWTATVALGGQADGIIRLDNCDPGQQVHRITTPSDVSLQFFLDYAGGTSVSDASGALVPLTDLGLVHRTPFGDADSAHYLTIVAPHNGTTVTIVGPATGASLLPPGGPGIAPGVPTILALDRFEHVVYSIDPPMGTWITADRPVAVFGTGSGSGSASQILPVEYAGMEYVACSPQAFRPQAEPMVTPSDRLWIVPIAGGITHVDLDPVPPGVPAGGLDIDATTADWATVPLPWDVHLRADQPILVFQDNMFDADGSGEMLLPVERSVRNGAFHAPPTFLVNGGQKQTWSFHAVQVATTASTTVTVDGAAVSSWNPVGGSGYRCGYRQVTAGMPHFVESDGPALFSGHGFGDSVWTDIAYMHLLYSGCLPADPPDAPAGLMGTATGGVVALSWSPPLDDGGCPVQEQRVHRRTGGMPWTQILSLPATASTAGDTIPLSCDAYEYKVTAVSAAGESGASNVVMLYHRGLPGVPTDPGIFAVSDGSATFDWGAPADDGGCPVLSYSVYGPGGALITSVPDSHFVASIDACAPFSIRVAAVNELGEGPATELFGIPATGGYSCLPPAKPRAPESSDADGDGAPDAHDACPAEAAPGGCVRESPPLPPLPMPDDGCGLDQLLPQDVAAVPGAAVTITWRAPEACRIDRFFVWNGTGNDLIASVAFDAGLDVYEVLDPHPWHRPHRYFVQTEAVPGPDVFQRDRAVPTDLVRGPGCAGCPQPPVGPLADDVGQGPVSSVREAAAGGSLLWIVLGLLAALSLWRFLQGGAFLRLFTRLSREELEEHPLRAQILDIVRADPGIHAAGIAERLQASKGSVRHHLRLLSGAGLLQHGRLGARTGYFAVGAAPQARQAALAVRTGTARRILDALSGAPAESVRDLAERVGVSYASVRHHVERFERAGLVTLERSTAGTRIRVRDGLPPLMGDGI